MNQESSFRCTLATTMKNKAWSRVLSSPSRLSQRLIKCTVSIECTVPYPSSDASLRTISGNALGASTRSKALAQMSPLRRLTRSGNKNKSDENVRSNNLTIAFKSWSLCSSLRPLRGSLTTLELWKPSKPEKKFSSSWSSSKRSKVHMRARVSISDDNFSAAFVGTRNVRWRA